MSVFTKGRKSLTPQQMAVMLNRKSTVSSKQFRVTLKCELSELLDALQKTGYLSQDDV